MHRLADGESPAGNQDTFPWSVRGKDISERIMSVGKISEELREVGPPRRHPVTLEPFSIQVDLIQGWSHYLALLRNPLLSKTSPHQLIVWGEADGNGSPAARACAPDDS
jgi:hypothetical protein